jgi:hypothetical protein
MLNVVDKQLAIKCETKLVDTAMSQTKHGCFTAKKNPETLNQ